MTANEQMPRAKLTSFKVNILEKERTFIFEQLASVNFVQIRYERDKLINTFANVGKNSKCVQFDFVLFYLLQSCLTSSGNRKKEKLPSKGLEAGTCQRDITMAHHPASLRQTFLTV